MQFVLVNMLIHKVNVLGDLGKTKKRTSYFFHSITENKFYEERKVSFLILDAIVNYWVVWVCGLVVGVFTFLTKRFVKLEKTNLETKQKERMTELRKEVKDEIIKEVAEEIDRVEQKGANLSNQIQGLKEEDSLLHAEIQELAGVVNTVNTGILSIQGRDFKSDCRKYLAPDYTITTEEFEQLEEEYAAYTQLGGNGRGTELFEAVKEKWRNKITG